MFKSLGLCHRVIRRAAGDLGARHVGCRADELSESVGDRSYAVVMDLENAVRERYLALNGDHPMTAADDAYVTSIYVPVPETAGLSREQVFASMLAGELPIPSYLLSTGEAMVHRDYLAPVAVAGSVAAVHDWFVAQWPVEAAEVAEAEWQDYLTGHYVCLWSATPATIQRKTALIEQIQSLVAAVGAGEGGARERLGEVVDALDVHEPPFTGYDRLRFGGPSSREVWIDDVRRDHLG